LGVTIYLRWVQTLEDYFDAKGCYKEKNFIINPENFKIMPNIGLNALIRRELFKKNLEPIVRVGSSNMDMRFNLNQFLEEKSIVTLEKIKVRRTKV